MLHHGSNDPVNSWVILDCIVGRVDANNLIVLVSGVLVDPIRVQNSQSSNTSSNSLLRDALQVPCELELSDTLVLGLAINNALGNGLLPASSSNGCSEDRKTLLRLVA